MLAYGQPAAYYSCIYIENITESKNIGVISYSLQKLLICINFWNKTLRIEILIALDP